MTTMRPSRIGLASALLAVSVVSVPVAGAGLLLHYPYDTPEVLDDDRVTDLSGRGNDGTVSRFGNATTALSPDVPATIAARSDRSVELLEDAEGYGARIGHAIPPFDLNLTTGRWSFASWFKRSSANAHGMVFHIGSGDGFGDNDEPYVCCPIGKTQAVLEHFAPAGRDIQLTRSNINTGMRLHPVSWSHLLCGRMTRESVD